MTTLPHHDANSFLLVGTLFSVIFFSSILYLSSVGVIIELTIIAFASWAEDVYYVRKMFIKRHRRLLNVLCTFSLHPVYRSSHPEVFCIKVVLRNFTKFTGKHL